MSDKSMIATPDLPKGYKERFCKAMYDAQDHLELAWDIVREFGSDKVEWEGSCFTIIVKLPTKREREMNEQITASEAVFGFAAWLMTREEPITMSAKHDASIVANLVKVWCYANQLDDPREGIYPDNIIHPE